MAAYRGPKMEMPGTPRRSYDETVEFIEAMDTKQDDRDPSGRHRSSTGFIIFVLMVIAAIIGYTVGRMQIFT